MIRGDFEEPKSVTPLFAYPICRVEETYKMDTTELNFVKNLNYYNSSFNKMSKNQNILNMPELSNLKIWIQKQINNYFFNLLKVKDIEEIYITQSWSNITEKGKSHHIHSHPNSIISGVLHFNEDDSSINFHSPSPPFCLDFNFLEYNILNSTLWRFPTKKYGLILFPSTLKHNVNTQEIARDRISLSFNTWIKGKVGDENTSTLLKIK